MALVAGEEAMAVKLMTRRQRTLQVIINPSPWFMSPEP